MPKPPSRFLVRHHFNLVNQLSVVQKVLEIVQGDPFAVGVRVGASDRATRIAHPKVIAQGITLQREFAGEVATSIVERQANVAKT